MNRGIYSLASGMIASQQSMDVVSNNLANVNTSGFKADQLLFNEELEKQMSLPGQGVIGKLGGGPSMKSEFTNFAQGSLNNTANSLDFALEGNGMFAVQSRSGQITYTRNGAFTQDASGNLITKDGNSVLDANGKPIQLESGAFSVSASGSIQNTATGRVYGQIGIYNGTFAKSSAGTYTSANAVAQAGKGGSNRVKQGALETSNVSSIGSMVQMISLQRNFDMAQRSMLAEDDMTQKLNTVLTN